VGAVVGAGVATGVGAGVAQTSQLPSEFVVSVEQ
jgi:hypothetical protein